MPFRYFIGGAVFFVPLMFLLGLYLTSLFQNYEPMRFIASFSMAALIFFTVAFFTKGVTKKILLFIISSLVIVFLGPVTYFSCILYIFCFYYLLFAKLAYRTKLTLFVVLLLIYWIFQLAAVLVIPIRWVGVAGLFFAIGIVKRSSYLFYEVVSEKITEISLVDFLFYLTYLPLAFPPIPVSPSEFMKGYKPTRKYPLHRTFFRGMMSCAMGVGKIILHFYMMYQWFPMLRFGKMYRMLGDLSTLEVWVIILVNYFCWYLFISSWFNISLGLSNMCGFRIKPNFNFPLFARDPLDLWKRWNIHTRGWLLRVFYFPLWWKYKITILNVLIVFIISGYLHTALGFVKLGVNWGYFLYFIIQGIAVMIVIIVKRGARVSGTGEVGGILSLGTLLSIAATYAYTALVHVLIFANFKGLDLYQTWEIFRKAFGVG